MAAEEDDPLNAFKAEISALEQAAVGSNDEERAATPPPEDRSFVDDDGTAYQWDHAQRRFVERGAAPAAPAYGVEEMTFAVEPEVIPAMPRREDLEDEDADEDDDAADAGAPKRPGADKRKLAEAFERERSKQKRAKEAADSKEAWFQLKQITSVYVTGLPPDATETEVAQRFSKCGVIKLDEEQRPRVKIYRDESGAVKGDGLVTYLKAPSVDLAVQIIDGTPLRDGLQQLLSVSQPESPIVGPQAKFEQKADFAGKKKPAKKQKAKKVLVKQEERELGWGGFDDVAPPTRTTVVLRNVFAPTDFVEDATLRDDLESDMAGECGKLGKVEKVKLYHLHPEGVVTIKYRDEDAAAQCVERMQGRFFGGRQLSASLWDGFTQFGKVRVDIKADTALEEEQRLAKFAQEIEGS